VHDIRAIRDDPHAFEAALLRRGSSWAGTAARVLALDEARRGRITAAEAATAEQNRASKEVGAAKARGDDAEFERLRALVAETKAEVARLTEDARAQDARLDEALLELPNLPSPDVPDGEDEAGNVEVGRWGHPRNFAFAPLEHYEIPAARAGMDFETAAKLSGSRFVLLSGAAARLHRALAQFMVDLHVEEHGLAETWTPVLVRDEAMLGTGQLPKFAEDSFRTTDGRWLVPTAEVTLTNIVAGHVIDEGTLPRRYVAHTPCFRSEAGSAGRDTAGMLRQHQFEKVEMVSVTTPSRSDEEQRRMLRCAETVLERLGIPYRTVVLCAGDMGFAARRTFDIEAWLPGQGKFREISSVSTCGDFQARRMNARFRPEVGGRPEFVHTLNGSGLAVGRTLIAVLENGQEEDGSVTLPEALRPYLRGAGRVTAEGALA
jgi:seryl-tRNA synthetase